MNQDYAEGFILCDTCNHKDHDAGRCDRCNCGEAEIVHPTGGWSAYARQVNGREGWVTDWDTAPVGALRKSAYFGKTPLSIRGRKSTKDV